MDSDNFKERWRQSQDRQDSYNERIRAVSARPDLGELSHRQRIDAYAEARRQQNIDLLNGFERMGFLESRNERHTSICASFREFDFNLVPNCGCADFLFELDLIFVQFNIPDTKKGHAELRREVDACIANLENLRSIFIGLNSNIDFAWAASLCEAEMTEHVAALTFMIKSYERVSAYLNRNVQQPKWRLKERRDARIELATRLLTIFHREFDIEPKPDGGSAYVPIKQANEWQRFFQACAYIRMGERETPDRQAILWEAFRNW